jgi:hypothetical protein
VFLGPTSFIGSSGGGDAVPFTSAGAGRAIAAFTIPASYIGGELDPLPSPVIAVAPGDHYGFGTYPAEGCYVPFTVTP